MNAIFERRAVREYTNEKIDEEKIQKLIDAFQAAPCALHQTEVMELSVITDPELLKKIEDNTNNSCYNAPLVFMINTKKDSQFGERDASVAAENVMVEAADLGLASVYVMGGVIALINSLRFKKSWEWMKVTKLQYFCQLVILLIMESLKIDQIVIRL